MYMWNRWHIYQQQEIDCMAVGRQLSSNRKRERDGGKSIHANTPAIISRRTWQRGEGSHSRWKLLQRQMSWYEVDDKNTREETQRKCVTVGCNVFFLQVLLLLQTALRVCPYSVTTSNILSESLYTSDLHWTVSEESRLVGWILFIFSVKIFLNCFTHI